MSDNCDAYFPKASPLCITKMKGRPATGPTACDVPHTCITEAVDSPSYDPSKLPQYSCLFPYYAPGWALTVPSPSGGPSTSVCAAQSALDSGVVNGDVIECVKYGDAWHLTVRGPNSKFSCYSDNPDNKHIQQLCLGDSICPLYANLEANQKCVQYPTKQNCANVIKLREGWNDLDKKAQDALEAKIVYSDSGVEGIDGDSGGNNTIIDVFAVLFVIAFLVLSFLLLHNVEKYYKKDTTNVDKKPTKDK